MIRMVLFALGFVAVTIALLVIQPGSGGRHADPAPEPVTRAEPALAPRPAADATAALPGLVGIPVPSDRDLQPQHVRPVAPQQDLGDQELRRMTWDTLANLNHATGQDRAPGQPGSLLHTIVRRSLDDGGRVGEPAATAPPVGLVADPGMSDADTLYTVVQGDTLVSIAEKIYGDVNMTGPLFATNQAVIQRPDALRPGQTLILPQR